MINCRITYIIAHHNYEKYLPNAIRSAKNQTYPNKICVIDDSSTNQKNVVEIITEHLFDNQIESEEHSGNKIILKGNGNTAILLLNGPYKQGYARNRGIEATLDETDVFAILDADDENYPNKLERLIPMFITPHIGVVYADYDTIDVENGRMCREFKEPFDLMRLRQDCIVHSGALIRKEALEAIKEEDYYDEDLPPCEDYDLFLRIAEKFMILGVSESLSLVKVHPQNSTNTSTHEFRINKLKKIHEKIRQRNEKPT
jgi:glycosyltransferase involved in cell wall biosynthesis